MNRTHCLLIAGVVAGLACAGCESFSKWRDKQTKIARGKYTEPTGPVQQGTATQPIFRPRMLNDLSSLDPDRPVILADVMLVNGLTVRPADVLEPLWKKLTLMAETVKPSDYPEQVRWVVRDQIRQTVNEFLVWHEVKRKITSEMQESLDKAVDKELRQRINKEYEGSQAKFERYLSQRGLSLEEYKVQEGRRIVVHQYLREEIMPQIRISRRQLQQFYTENRRDYETPGRVKLQMIDIPIAAFLPEGRRDAMARQEAYEKARAAATKALEELQGGKDFAEVARAYSKGIHAEDDGRWDWISEDSGLTGRWTEASNAAFRLPSGAFSGLIETPDGFFIVRAEEKVEGHKRVFEEVQKELEDKLRDKMFLELSQAYLMKLYAKADIQGYEAFLQTVLRQVPKPAASSGPAPGAR